MKKSAVLLGGVCLLALIGGGVMMMNSKGGGVSLVKASYWDENTSINAADEKGELPLIKAVKANDVAGAKFLLEKGADINTKDKAGLSALDIAFDNHNNDMIETLLANSNQKLEDAKYVGKAIEANDAKLLEFILKNGGDANKALEIKGRYRPDEELDYTDPRVVSPLKKAVDENKPEIAKVLLENGAKGASYFLEKELLKADIAMVEVLAEYAGNLRNMAVKGMDLLVSTANEGSPELLAFLLKKNAGDANEALSRLLTYREDSHFNEAVKMFLEAGATPKLEILPQMIKKGNQEIFEEIAGCLIDPNITIEQSQQSLLRYSVENGYDKVVDFLLEHKANIWQEDKDGKSALMVAVQNMNKNPEIYQKLKKQIKEINETGYRGETLLMLVASTGDYKEFENIVSAGGDIWQRDLEGKTVMMYAAEGNGTKIINYLATKGDNVNTGDKEGKTALMYAAESAQKESSEALIRHKADIKAVDHEGRAAIMYAAKSGSAEILNMLLDAGERTAIKDNRGKNVLMYAAEGGHISTLSALKERSIETVAQDFDGVSVLSYAVQSDNPEAVRFLLDNGARREIEDKKGYHPITWALQSGNKEIFDMLIGTGIGTMTAQTRDNGKTLSIYAMEGKNKDLISWATENLQQLINVKDRFGRSFFMLLAKDGRPDVVREALSTRANVNAKDNQGKSVLMYAAQGEAAVNLISILPYINEEFYSDERDNEGRSALMYAVGGQYNQSIKQQRLLQHKANVNGQDNEGKSVLMYAVGNPYARVDAQAVRELIDEGADVNAKDSEGKTALMYAAQNPNANAKVVETLLDAKADIKAVDNNNQTVLMYAAESGDISKFKLLIEKGAEKGGKTKDGDTVQSIADQVNHCFAKAVKGIL